MKKYAYLTLLLATPGCIADLTVPVPEEAAECTAPEGRDVLLDVFPSCDLGMCGDLPEHQMRGRCVDDNQLDAGQLVQLAACANTATPQHCVPVGLLLADGRVKPPVCDSVGGAEGRCMSLCIPQIQGKKDSLPQSSCADGERCAPCYDPFTGESSGACESNACDAPVDDPVVFAGCCADKGGGNCVPRSLVADDSEASLSADSCANPEANICVPTGMSEPDFQPATCRSVGDAEGRCVSLCVPAIHAKKDSLPQATCDVDQRCAPCFDPFTGESSGVCELGSTDMPVEEPVTFAGCCADKGGGNCVPRSLVADDSEASLSADSCANPDANVCVPTGMSEPDFQPAACRSVGNAEGRCVSLCVPAIYAKKDSLPQATCDANQLCAPCYDPFTGEPSGVCELGSTDMPAEPPVTFAGCCADKGGGNCVPRSLVADDSEASLSADSCANPAADVCVPTGMSEPDFQPADCRSVGNAEGRCVSLCVPAIQAKKDSLPQATCDVDQRCAPCYDPFTGESSGVCELGADDMPAEPPVLFAACCQDKGGGNCVPRSLVADDSEASLSADSCANPAADVCVPTGMSEPDFQPATCRSIGNFEGRCVSLCVPEIYAKKDSLPQATCDANQLCAPCYDPFTGESSGVCELGAGDMPAEPPSTFAACCEDKGGGSCVPRSAVPDESEGSLGEDSCANPTADVCVPTGMSEPDFLPVACETNWIASGQGLCLSECIPLIGGAVGSVFARGTCTDTQRCVACSNLVKGQSATIEKFCNAVYPPE